MITVPAATVAAPRGAPTAAAPPPQHTQPVGDAAATFAPRRAALPPVLHPGPCRPKPHPHAESQELIERVRRRAFEIFCFRQASGIYGDAEADWVCAEREVMQHLREAPVAAHEHDAAPTYRDLRAAAGRSTPDAITAPGKRSGSLIRPDRRTPGKLSRVLNL